MSKFQSYLKLLIGILLLPVVFGLTITFYRGLKFISGNSMSGGQWIFLTGIFSYSAAHLFLFKPNYLYVFGHELTHAVAAWVCGGKVKGFKVSRRGGSVRTSKSNFFISLAPYFIPSYVLIFSLIYFILSLIFTAVDFKGCFIFALGAAIAFHLIMTAEVLKKEQPDILKTGYIFSLVFIFLFNVIILALIFSRLFDGFSIDIFFKEAFFVSKQIYIKIFARVF